MKKLDGFTRNIILVFTGFSAINLINLIYQTVVLNKLNPADFAAFNTLLSIFFLVSMPLQIVLAKYSAELRGKLQDRQIKVLFTHFLKKTLILAAITLAVFLLVSPFFMRLLRIESPLSGIIMSLLLASAWVVTVFSGQLQGMELFGWLTFATCVSATVKLILAFILMNIGMSYPGALSALLFSNILTILICLFPLRRFIVSSPASEHVLIKKEAQAFLLPVAVSSFCCIALVAMDMILVKRYFIPEQAGIYSYAQFIGKIFYFLPGAISIVILPHSSNLDARKEDTIPLLKRSLFYTAAICLAAFIFYNIFDGLALKAFRLLNPGITPQVISLGRLFGISMSFFAMLSVLISYFISRKDARFIKFLVAFTVLQCLTIIIFHKDLFMVQTILCLNAVLLLAIHLLLAFAKRPKLFVCSREALNLP